MKIENRTQLFQPLKTPLSNQSSYYFYTLRQRFNLMHAVGTVVLVCSIIGSVTDLLDFFGQSWMNRLFYLFCVLASLLAKTIDYAKHYDERFTTSVTRPDAYENIEPPNSDWVRQDLYLSKTDVEPIYFCDKVDQWLRGRQPIALERDQNYEKSLHRAISSDERWDSLYHPFLQNNFLDAMFHGKQFYNEKKFGISSELIPGAPSVSVHKTCYYDSFLTNIIPGRELISNRDGEVVAQTYFPDMAESDLMPYHQTTDGRRRLKLLDEMCTANEPGVSTLCLLPNGSIRLWRQNRMAQCSVNRIVASGSGSADWNDCRTYFGKDNGFRKAVIKGMQRELWEESSGSRELRMDRFMNAVDTRIIGYFRWLKKSGKSEFVGISRLCDAALTKYLTPEKSEVTQGETMSASTMRELIDNLRQEIHPIGEERFEVNRCSVSCAAAMLALQRTCSAYCTDTCRRYDKVTGHCIAEACTVKPFQALFEDTAIVHP